MPILSTSSFRSAAQARHHLLSNHRSQAPRPRRVSRAPGGVRDFDDGAANPRRRRQVAQVSATVRKKAIRQQAAAMAPTRRVAGVVWTSDLLHFLHRHRAVSPLLLRLLQLRRPAVLQSTTFRRSGEAGVPPNSAEQPEDTIVLVPFPP